MNWMDRDSAIDEREWRMVPKRAFPLQGQWWEVTTNGEFVGVRATVGTTLELQQLIAAMQAYVSYFEEREAESDAPSTGNPSRCTEHTAPHNQKGLGT